MSAKCRQALLYNARQTPLCKVCYMIGMQNAMTVETL